MGLPAHVILTGGSGTNFNKITHKSEKNWSLILWPRGHSWTCDFGKSSLREVGDGETVLGPGGPRPADREGVECRSVGGVWGVGGG